MLCASRVAGPQLGVLRRDADGAGVQVADPHHHAAGDDQRGGGESVLLGAQQRRDHDVPARLHLPVDLDRDPIPQAVQQQGLLRLGEAELPGGAGVLEGVQRARAGAAVVPGDQHDVGVGLGHARRDRAHPEAGDQLDVDARGGVRGLRVVDQLGEVLDRVDVVVRRRGDEPDARGRVAGPRDPGVDLLGRELTSLAGLRPLRHLDLDVAGEGQVLAGHAEASGGDLLDRAAPLGVVEALGVLSSLTAVGHAAQAVHGDGEGLVGLLRDGAVAHRAGHEAPRDLLDRLDLRQRDRLRGVGAQAQQAAHRQQPLVLLVDRIGVGAELVVLPRPRGVLQAEHRLGGEQVRLALAAPLVLPAHRQAPMRRVHPVDRVREGVARGDLRGDDVQVDPADAAGGAGEPGVHQLLGQAHGLEDLRASVGGDRRDAHLGHDLQDALGQGPREVRHRLLGGEIADHAAPDQLLDALHGEIGGDRARAVADQERRMVHLAHVPGLDHERGRGAPSGAHEVVLDGAGQQQRRDRGEHLVGVAVGEDQEGRALVDRGDGLLADLLEAGAQRRGAPGDRVQAAQPHRAEVRGGGMRVDGEELGELVPVEDRGVQGQLAGMLRRRVQEVPRPADAHPERGDDLLAQGVQRRVGDLREHLREVVEQEPRPVREHRDRGVCAHRAERLGALRGHRGQQHPQLLLGVAEGLLAAQHGGAGVGDVLAAREGAERDLLLLHPGGVGAGGGDLVLEAVAGDDLSGVEVEQEDLPRRDAAGARDRSARHVHEPRLGTEDDQVVLHHPVAQRPQAVAVQTRADLAAVGEDDRRGPVPGLLERRVELVEGPQVGVHRLVVLPRLGHEHHQGVGQGAAREVQQLGDLVEPGGVRAAGGRHRQQPGEVLAEGVGRHGALCGAHTVAVADHRVDLAVVGEGAEGVRERPGREGVGGEAGVDDRQLRGEARISQVGIELVELHRGEHSLVDHHAGREGGEVALRGVLDAATGREDGPLEVEAYALAARVGEEDLHEVRPDRLGGGADEAVGHGHLTGAEQAQPLLRGDAPEGLEHGGAAGGVAGHEGGAGGVLPERREVEAADGAEERVRQLDHDPGAVAGVLLGADGTAVVEVAQRLEGVRDDPVVRRPAERRDHRDAAGVDLAVRAVEALGGGHGRETGGEGEHDAGALQERRPGTVSSDPTSTRSRARLPSSRSASLGVGGP